MSVPALRDTLAATARERGWVAKPYYRADLVHIANEGWDWYVSTLSGEDEIPRVRASDRKLDPFNR